MTDRYTITLPREAVEKAIKAFENGCPSTCEKGMVDSGGFHPWGEPALVPCPACLAFEHLRTALAAEQPKPEPVAKACWACNGKGCLRDIDTAGLLPCVVCKPQEDKT